MTIETTLDVHARCDEPGCENRKTVGQVLKKSEGLGRLRILGWIIVRQHGGYVTRCPKHRPRPAQTETSDP